MDNALSIDTGLVRKILTEFIHSEIGRAGFSRAVVNLSGGIDSAVSFTLAVGALGPQNVLAVRLPYKTSSADSLEHAQVLIDQFGCPSATIPITEMVDPLIALDSEISDMRKGNIMARARMIVAYDQSEAFKGWSLAPVTRPRSCLGTLLFTAIQPARLTPPAICTRPRCASWPVHCKFPMSSLPNPLLPTCGPAKQMKGSSALPMRM